MENLEFYQTGLLSFCAFLLLLQLPLSWLAYRAKRNGSACDHNASLAAVIDSTGQSVCVLDQDLRVVDYNHAWHDLWLKAGQPPSDVVEDNFKNLCEAMRINGTSASELLCRTIRE